MLTQFGRSGSRTRSRYFRHIDPLSFGRLHSTLIPANLRAPDGVQRAALYHNLRRSRGPYFGGLYLCILLLLPRNACLFPRLADWPTWLALCREPWLPPGTRSAYTFLAIVKPSSPTRKPLSAASPCPLMTTIDSAPWLLVAVPQACVFISWTILGISTAKRCTAHRR